MSPSALPSGTTLAGGRYRVEAMLGKGGFAFTYTAFDAHLERMVVIKELFPPGAVRSGSMVIVPEEDAYTVGLVRGRFIEEARVLARFTHPNIVRVYEAFSENDTGYIVLEHLNGVSLDVVLRNGPLAHHDVDRVVREVASALDHVHHAGLLHRDIKPSNIVRCNDGRHVLIDFGAARSFFSENTNTMTGFFSAGYTPLEQYGGGESVGPATDVYALSATAYHLLVGKAPTDSVRRAAGLALEPLDAEVARRVPGLARAIGAGLSLAIAERPQSIEGFLAIAGSPGGSGSGPDARGADRQGAPTLPLASRAEVSPTSSAMPGSAGVAVGGAAVPTTPRSAMSANPAMSRRRRVRVLAVPAVLVLVLLGVSAVVLANRGGSKPGDDPVASTTPTSRDRVVPDTAAPDTAAPDIAAPDTAAPDTAAPDTAAPDTAAPDTAAPDTVAPDTAAPDTSNGRADPSRAVVTVLNDYFRSLDNVDYRTAWSLFTPAFQRRAPSFDKFVQGNRGSSRSALELVAVTATGPASASARVTFTSNQPAAIGPGGQTCTNWDLTYLMVRTAVGWRIDRVRNNPNSPSAC